MDSLPPPAFDDLRPGIDLPPDYDGSGSIAEELPTPGVDLPPAYPVNLPNSFPIGAQETHPLVKLTEVESHLRLLGAFWQLRQDVVTSAETGTSWDELSQAERWIIFVSRASWRFELWYTNLLCRPGRDDKPLTKDELPPLDVAMVWHAYILNPLEYLEEGLVRSKRLLKMGYYPLARIAASIHPLSMRPLDPPHNQTFTFEAHTGQPFLFSTMVLPSETIQVPCPRCKFLVEVPWYNEDRKGFGQPGFLETCRSCLLDFGKEAMGVRRLAEHIQTWIIRDKANGQSLAGTLIDYTTGMPDFKKAYFFNRKILQYFESVCKKDEQKTPAGVGDMVKWNTSQAEYCIRIGMRLVDNTPSPQRWGRVLSHYTHAGIFSMDLIGATLRQSGFIKEMVDLGWTRAGTFATDKTILARSIARYHAWLDLFASNPNLTPVPTLDIDLIWHTNMLYADRYRADTYKLLGRIPDHDDKVEETALADAFDETARAWRSRFGVPYSLCGCAPTVLTDSTLSKLKSIGRRNSSTSRVNMVDIQSLVGKEDNDSEDAVTHPSTHYSVLVLDSPAVDQARNKRTDDLRKLREQARKAAAKGRSLSPSVAIGRPERIEPKPGHMQAFRRARPGPEEERRAIYSAFLVDGKAHGGGHCAVGVAGGICQINGTAVFCTSPGRCQAGGGYGMMMRGGDIGRFF
ncbi:hypothetical protein CALCODRAFT_461001 [Calocera cornea HHB12733]|uniref:Uncharacterized protein n=1 Tax=Calocera cornea HHB12733 TaxID=1353952 RepID=A0A165CL66_9BASI|nr:hypothetical protein CALCODRAFT_461001 [Calocera cornea HHB12733]